MKKKIYKDIHNLERLLAAYYKVSSRKGKGVDNETGFIDGINLDWFSKISGSLKDHSLRFKPIRKMYKDGSRRPLGIPNLRDKIILKSMEMSLSEVYEPIFSNHSHGFRRNRSCHSCLGDIKYGWQGTKWFIEGDINSYFENIDHKILEKILMETFSDRELIDLYWKAVRVDYIGFPTGEWEKGLKGVPQGSTLSPVLSNIYLHKLDLFMEKKIEESLETGNTSLPNPEYKKIHSDISNLRAYFRDSYRYKRRLSDEETKDRIVEIKKLEKKRAKLSSRIDGPGYRIRYVRYADDFLIGVNGNEDVCIKLKEELKEFLWDELKLRLDDKKTKITSATKSRATFLGANIKVNKSRTHDQPRSKKGKGSCRVVKRYPVGGIQLLVPLEYLTKKLADQGICRIVDFRNRKIIPTRKTAWRNLSLKDIVRKYGLVWRGILNYYSFADNRSQLNLIQFLLHHSCACTIGDKMKLRSRAKVFKKFGKNLEVEKGIKFPLKNSLKKISFRLMKGKSETTNYPLDVFNWALRSRINLGEACSICSSTIGVEMHHRRPLKGHDSTVVGIEKSQSRKQIPLCRNCHMKVHRGEYDGRGIY